MNNIEKFRKIKAFVFDVDGVLCNQHIFVFENGQIMRQLHQKDLTALRIAKEQGYEVAIISGGNLGHISPIFKDMGITNIFHLSRDKKEDYIEFINLYELEDEEVLYMGDDLPDYQVMRRVGMPTCPKTAVPEVKEIALYVSPFNGGEGCVRDVIEKVLRIKRKWLATDGPPKKHKNQNQ